MSTVTGTTRLLSRHPHDPLEPIVWPVTVPQLRSHAQIRHQMEDELLQCYIADATEYVESRGQVSLITQRQRQVLGYLPFCETIAAHRGPLVSVQSVNYLDSGGNAVNLLTGWRADTRSSPGGIYFDDSTRSIVTAEGPGVCWIDVTTGYSDDPEQIPAQWKQLILVVATHLYQRRELASGGGYDAAFEAALARKFSSVRNIRYV